MHLSIFAKRRGLNRPSGPPAHPRTEHGGHPPDGLDEFDHAWMPPAHRGSHDGVELFGAGRPQDVQIRSLHELAADLNVRRRG